jgi:hypothetical protein
MDGHDRFLASVFLKFYYINSSQPFRLHAFAASFMRSIRFPQRGGPAWPGLYDSQQNSLNQSGKFSSASKSHQ